jgi:hypothetical protein
VHRQLSRPVPNSVRILTVTDADRARLERRARNRGGPARVTERARIVLLTADGLTGPQIAQTLKLRRGFRQNPVRED